MSVYGDNPTVGNGYRVVDEFEEKQLARLRKEFDTDMTKKNTENKTVFIAMQGEQEIDLDGAYGMSADLDEALENAAENDSLEDVVVYEVKILAKYSVSTAKKYKLTKIK